MRTWGRPPGSSTWQEISTDADGNDDAVWFTTLAQCLQLTPGESPFFSNYGIPAQQSIATQIFPDYYVAQMQSLFSQYFMSLLISRAPAAANANPSNPVYNVNVVTHRGVVISQPIGV
jgi:hypothetical protein